MSSTTEPSITYDGRTIFTPPSSCLGDTYTLTHTKDRLFAYPDTESTSIIQGLNAIMRGLDPACYPQVISPSGHGWYYSHLPTFPHATCPVGYTSRKVEPGYDGALTTMTCCPSSYSALMAVDVDVTSTTLCFVKKTTANVITIAYADYGTTTTSSTSGRWFFAYPIVVQNVAADSLFWTSSTGPPFLPSTARSAEPQESIPHALPTSSSSPRTNDPANDPRLALKVGLGVGFNALFFAILIFVLWYRRKKVRPTMDAIAPSLQSAHETLQYHKPELPGEGNYKAELEEKKSTDTPFYELPSPDQRPAELDGDWRGTEAAALVEVDFSRPQRGKEAAKMERLEQIH